MGRIDIYIHPAPRRAVRDADSKCPRCNGTGSIQIKGLSKPEKCPKCQGTGQMESKDNLIAGNHRPEGVHAKDTPIVDARTFTKEHLAGAEAMVEKAKSAYAAAPMGMSRAARKKDLEEAEAWLVKVRKAQATDKKPDILDGILKI